MITQIKIIHDLLSFLNIHIRSPVTYIFYSPLESPPYSPLHLLL